MICFMGVLERGIRCLGGFSARLSPFELFSRLLVGFGNGDRGFLASWCGAATYILVIYRVLGCAARA